MHLFLHFNLRLPKEPASAKARIVDQQGQARLCGDAIRHNRQFLFIGQVGRQHGDVTSILSRELSPKRVQPIPAARNQKKIVLCGKLSRKNNAKPARRSRNHCQSLSHKICHLKP